MQLANGGKCASGLSTWQERGVYAAILPCLDCKVTAKAPAGLVDSATGRRWFGFDFLDFASGISLHGAQTTGFIPPVHN
jgi:hypothetical protein